MVRLEESLESRVRLTVAAKRLGVNASTLRRWADNGQVPSYRTAGGHRRFSVTELDTIISSNGNGSRATISSAVVSRVRRSLAHNPKDASWNNQFKADDREDFRRIGSRLIALADDYIISQRKSPDAEREIASIGREYGILLYQQNMSLSKAVNAFIYFRRQIEETTKELSRQKSLNFVETSRAQIRTGVLCDLVLQSIADVYNMRD
jgi:excisionase family DNA binding protein